MATIKITSKRQATFPVSLCRELNLKPGTEVSVEERIVNGKSLWVLIPHERSRQFKMKNAPWLGALNEYARNKKHDLASIRRSIVDGKT